MAPCDRREARGGASSNHEVTMERIDPEIAIPEDVRRLFLRARLASLAAFALAMIAAS